MLVVPFLFARDVLVCLLLTIIGLLHLSLLFDLCLGTFVPIGALKSIATSVQDSFDTL